MATPGTSVSLTLNTLVTLPNPTALYQTGAKSVQIQNASPFILNVVANGEQYIVQSFTAQTIPLPGSGDNVTVLPTNGPAGTQGTLTPVWLLDGDEPPIADGQLTGAAQYAQGLGSKLAALSTSGLNMNQNVSVPPNIRTLVITAQGNVGSLLVQGNSSGFPYYTGPPYLRQIGSFYTIIVPVVSLADPVILVSITLTANGGTASVYGDTAAYDESFFYNGIPAWHATQLAAAGSLTIVSGPCRLLVINGQATGGAQCFVNQGVAENYVITTVQGQSLSMPPNVILPQGQSVTLTQVGAGNTSGAVLAAYP